MSSRSTISPGKAKQAAPISAQPELAAGQAPAAKTRTRAAKTRLPANSPTDEERQRFVAEAAYFRAERRGFTQGGELDDWLEAEAEIDARLRAS